MTTLTDAKFANLKLYSDVDPYEIVRVISETTVEIRAMSVTRDPSWKPEFAPGGFAGHCVNQNEQRWIYTSNPEAPVIRMRAVKRTQRNRMMAWKSAMGHHVLSENPVKYHDFNF